MYFKLQLSAAMHSINPWGSRSADVNQCSFTGSSTAMPVYTSLGSVHSNLTMALPLHFIFSSPVGKYICINICLHVYVYVCMHVCVSSSLHITVIAHVWMVRKRAEREAGARVLYSFLKQNCLFEITKTFAEEESQSPPKNVPGVLHLQLQGVSYIRCSTAGSWAGTCVVLLFASAGAWKAHL